ncbi:MAG: hypothetical protein Q7S16_03570 [bacterium]|nr:hypothetical protein [bacterium]
MEKLILAIEYGSVLAFLGWCLWTTSPKHPERLEKLRRKLGVS